MDPVQEGQTSHNFASAAGRRSGTAGLRKAITATGSAAMLLTTIIAADPACATVTVQADLTNGFDAAAVKGGLTNLYAFSAQDAPMTAGGPNANPFVTETSNGKKVEKPPSYTILKEKTDYIAIRQEKTGSSMDRQRLR